jgi:hypothetical protein
MTYARIVDGVAVEIVPFDPAGRYDPTWVWVECLEGTKPGATYDGSEFTNPVEPEPVEPTEPQAQYRTLVTPPEFKRLFTMQERIAIAVARQGGSTAQEMQVKLALDVFYEDIDDPRTEQLDLAHPDLVAGLDFVQSIGVIDADRKAEIAKGVLV